MENIGQFKIQYFGEPYLKGINLELTDVNETKPIPATLIFNSPWRILHTCPKCGNEVKFIEDGQKPERNYRLIKEINSISRNEKFLNQVCDMFQNLEQIKVDGTIYVNRTDFSYQFDMQRKMSIDLKHHRCINCKADFLSIIRIGYPVEGEKGLENRLGGIEVVQITVVDIDHILIDDI